LLHILSKEDRLFGKTSDKHAIVPILVLAVDGLAII
jgi:hypothetical protein